MLAPFKEGKIFYKTTGKGHAVILLHGFMESSEMWVKQIDFLKKSNKIITVDLPGHGNSDCFGYMHTMEFMADAVQAVIKKLRLRKVILVGHSMGGYVSLALAKKNPKILKGICLFHSTAAADTDERRKLRIRAIEVVKRNKRMFINEAIPVLYAPDFRNHHKADIKYSKEMALGTSIQGIIAAIEGMKQRSSSEEFIKQADFTIAFIMGRKDAGIPFESVLKQAKSAKRSYSLVLDEVAHMGFVEEPEGCNKFLSKFIRICFS
jgi:pimeloyl-ACP methyl ester carboxylesterase